MELGEGHTKDRIIVFLKKTGGITAEDLSKLIGITPMGIRQHLLSLERKGMVRYEAKKHGIGRPVFVYKLTDKADEVFPKSYPQFALDILKDVEAVDGRQKVVELLKIRKERILKERSQLLGGSPGFPEKVNALFRMYETEGYLVEIRQDEKRYILKKFNCPLSRVAVHYPEICAQELELMQDLLGTDVQRSECMAQGDYSCTFNIAGS